MSLLSLLDFQKRSAAPTSTEALKPRRCWFDLCEWRAAFHGTPGKLCVGACASVHAFVHLAAQLVFSSEMIASHRFTKSDHRSAESVFTSPILAISALSRRAVAR
jgi:hypothetical protein